MTKLNIHNCGGGATVEALLGGFCKISCDKCGAFVQAYGYEMTRELWNKRGDTVPFEDGDEPDADGSCPSELRRLLGGAK